MPSGCLFCRRKQRLFRINMVYDNTGKPIKNFIVEFLGSCEQYLDDDHGICSTCVFLLNKLLFLRKYMYLLAASTRDDECNNTPYLKFSYVYKYFLENLQKVSYEECDSEADNNLSELLRIVHSSPYEEEQEAQYGRSFGTPYADREVEDTIRRRRGRSRGRGKRRGHNWTRHKSSGARAKSRMTTYSEPAHETGRANSSIVNFSEYYDSNRSDSDDENDNEVAANMENAERRLNGILGNRTSFSPDPEAVTIPIYKCIDRCSFEFHNLEEMTNHKINVHGMLANYICYECYATKFVSPEDLKLHNDLLHGRLISHCFLCSAELETMEDLQKHLREHRFHSYPCHYCEMSFLDRQSCKAHISDCHKGKRKRIRRSERCTLIGRMYKSNDTSTEPSEPDEKYKNKIIWRLQSRKPVKRLSTICIDVIKRCYQGSVDISSLIEGPCISIIPNKPDNHTIMEISDATESSIQMENEIITESGDQSMEINCNETQSNSEGVPIPVIPAETTDNGTKDINVFHEEIDEQTFIVNGILDIPDDIPEIMTETDVYTSEEVENNIDFSSKPGTSDSSFIPENRNKNNVLLTTADRFERFIKNNSTKDDQLDETKSNPKILNNKNKIKPSQHLNDR